MSSLSWELNGLCLLYNSLPMVSFQAQFFPDERKIIHMDNGQNALAVRLGSARVTWPISPCKFFIHWEQMGAILGKEVLSPPRDIWKCLEAFEIFFS